VTLFIDTSALLVRYLATGHTAPVDALMAADPVWCVSALAGAEVAQVLRLATTDAIERSVLEARFRDDWAACRVVPVDDRCLTRAAEIGAQHRVTAVTAVHMAAADRLPRPVGLVSLDADQIPVALALGLEPLPP
jgi:uncharacterized protein